MQNPTHHPHLMAEDHEYAHAHRAQVQAYRQQLGVRNDNTLVVNGRLYENVQVGFLVSVLGRLAWRGDFVRNV